MPRDIAHEWTDEDMERLGALEEIQENAVAQAGAQENGAENAQEVQ